MGNRMNLCCNDPRFLDFVRRVGLPWDMRGSTNPTSDHPELLLGGYTAMPSANPSIGNPYVVTRRFVSPLL